MRIILLIILLASVSFAQTYVVKDILATKVDSVVAKALALTEATTKIDTMEADTLDFTVTEINNLLNNLINLSSDSTTVQSGEYYYRISDGILRRKE